MTCDRLDQLHGYLDGELSLQERAQTEEHLKSCEVCAQAYDQYRHMHTLLEETLDASAPANLQHKVLQTVRAKRRSKWIKTASSAAAAVVLGICLLQAAWQRSPEGVTIPSEASYADGWAENTRREGLPSYLADVAIEQAEARLQEDCRRTDDGLMVRVTKGNQAYLLEITGETHHEGKILLLTFVSK